MKFMLKIIRIIFLNICLFSSFSSFALENGVVAPDFKLMTASGKLTGLKDFKGKTVVLEWTNHGCPFVRKHYDSGNMQSLQKKYTQKDIIWLSIISSAEGKQGYVKPDEALADKKKFNSSATDVLLDPKGEVGLRYEAKTTPHMFIISKDGKLVDQGAIDSINSTDPNDIKSAENYIEKALDSILSKKPIKVSKTKSYGCSVKY
jgi:glutathione peroxidase-family protein